MIPSVGMPTSPKATREPHWAKKYANSEQETISDQNSYNLTIKNYAVAFT